MECDIAIVGAGLSGLNAAVHLHKAGKKVAVFEANAHVGGRVATEKYQGFLLDKGFQVYFTAYSEGKAALNYATLGFHAFKRGAVIHSQGRFYKLVDPSDSKKSFLKSVFSPLIKVSDTWSFLKLLYRFRKTSSPRNFNTAEEALGSYGFSKPFYKHFLRPFFWGVLLDPSLQCPAPLVDLTMRMLLEGNAVLPKRGMQAIPEQLATKLPPGIIHLNSRVKTLDAGGLILEGGRRVIAPVKLIACALEATCQLLHKPLPPQGRNTYCFYFAAPVSPLKGYLLLLNGDVNGLINHIAILSDINPAYSPKGSTLISITVLRHAQNSEAELITRILAESRMWFGEQVKEWKFLKSFFVENAHPANYPNTQFKERKEYRIASQTYICGDYLEAPSMQNALGLGRKAAEQILREI